MTDIQKFFKRIGLSPDTKIEYTYDLLKLIQYNAVTSIPYENLDILDGKPLSLNAEDLFTKIVENNRGGYCFELNALFSGFLKKIGFQVKDHFARCLRNELTIPMRRHRMMTVSLDGERYFTDIGVANVSPREPLLLRENLIQEQFGEKYRFEKDDSLGWVLWDFHKGEWRKFISFTEEEQYEVDFVQPSFFCEAHPDSIFNKVPMLAIKTPTGRKIIDNRDFKIFEGAELVYIEENISDSRFEEVLKKEFFIKLKQEQLYENTTFGQLYI